MQDSIKKYDESLSLQNDENLRSECDKKLYDLSMRIAKEENEVAQGFPWVFDNEIAIVKYFENESWKQSSLKDCCV